MAEQITIDDDVKQMILDAKEDYRVCTACRGPALVPISVKMPKESDLKFKIGDHILYVSAVQAMYISRVSMDMLYNERDIFSCPALSQLRDSGALEKKY